MISQADQILEADKLRVVFRQVADRWAHSIELLDGESFVPWLTSLEGKPDEDWPSSPPLQQLSCERHEGRPVLLLVGMAGKSHWSLSVDVEPQSGRATFDVACRRGGEGVSHTRSTYLSADGMHAAKLMFEQQMFAVSRHSRSPGLLGRALDNTNVAAEGPFLFLSNGLSSGEASSPTVRWRYSLEPWPAGSTPRDK